jgi:hypothetical protein
MRRTKSLKLITLILCVSIAAISSQGQVPKFSGFAIRVSVGSDKYRLRPILGDGTSGLMTVPLSEKSATGDGQQPSTLTISAQRTGEQWDVRAWLGLKTGGDLSVARSKLQTGEVLNLARLAEFGLTGWQVSIVRIEAVPAVQPEIVDRTSSISLVSIEADVVPGPYLVTLRNNSNKPVQGVELRNYKGKKLLSYFPPEGSINRPLIEPGGTYVAMLETAADYDLVGPDLYRPHQSDLIEISSVVFVDGSFEGQLYNASVVVARQIGSNAGLDAFIRAIESALTGTSDSRTVAGFKQAIIQTDIEVGSSIEQLSHRFPTLRRDEIVNLTSVIRRGFSEARVYVLSDLSEFERTTIDGSSFETWLVREKAKLEQWRRKQNLAS